MPSLLERLAGGPVAVMGVLNVTPDSFSDGGRYAQPASAVDRVAQMLAQGAALIDVGGESTRPGAEPVSVQQELDRVMPVIEAIRRRFDAPVSLDTSKPEVVRAGLACGVAMINDVTAMRDEQSRRLVAEAGVTVCLMHMRGTPRTMQQSPAYGDVLVEVVGYLNDAVDACLSSGCKPQAICLDPGFGFGKTLRDNYLLLQGLERLVALGYPLLVGISRKSMIGNLLGRAVDERLAGGLAAALIAAQKGARIVRTHDVRETVDALRVWDAVRCPDDIKG